MSKNIKAANNYPEGNILGSEKVGRLLRMYAVPSIISMLVNALYNIVDQIFIGWGVGYLGNGATNIIFPITIVFAAFALMFGDGSAAYMSLKLGAGKKDEAASGVANGIILSIATSGVLTVIVLALFPRLLSLFGCTAELEPYARDYGYIIIIGLPFQTVCATVNSVIRADGSPKYAMFSMMSGALLAGFVAGYLVLGIERLCEKLPASIEGIKPILLYPVLGVFATSLVMMGVNPVMGAINSALSGFLNGLSGTSIVLLGIIVAGMQATDMGGPINKAAYVFGTAALAEQTVTGNMIMAAVMAGGMVPPLAIALSTTLFKNRWTEADRKAGIVNYVMGLSFITEGAIPFAASDPLRVLPACIAGSATAGGLSMLLGCASPAPHGGAWVIAVITNPAQYLVALAAGAIVGCLVLSFLKKPLPPEQSGLVK